jgi:hypothetical protein
VSTTPGKHLTGSNLVIADAPLDGEGDRQTPARGVFKSRILQKVRRARILEVIANLATGVSPVAHATGMAIVEEG